MCAVQKGGGADKRTPTGITIDMGFYEWDTSPAQPTGARSVLSSCPRHVRACLQTVCMRAVCMRASVLGLGSQPSLRVTVRVCVCVCVCECIRSVVDPAGDEDTSDPHVRALQEGHRSVVHIVQVLPTALAARALMFDWPIVSAADTRWQKVSPGFFDAPGESWAHPYRRTDNTHAHTHAHTHVSAFNPDPCFFSTALRCMLWCVVYVLAKIRLCACML